MHPDNKTDMEKSQINNEETTGSKIDKFIVGIRTQVSAYITK